ncbi:uncharacterized protein LOC142419826 isoform X3 [Mycteria americana]
MATPEGSRCRWEQISSTYSELSGCTQLLAQLLSCPWPGAVLDTFFLQRLPLPGRRLLQLQQRAGPGAPARQPPEHQADGFQMQPLTHERSRGALEQRLPRPRGVRRLCQDICWGAQSPARSSFTAGRVPPSCASSSSDSRSARPTGGLLKGKLWAHALPRVRGEMSSLGLSPVLGQEHRRPAGPG